MYVCFVVRVRIQYVCCINAFMLFVIRTTNLSPNGISCCFSYIDRQRWFLLSILYPMSFWTMIVKRPIKLEKFLWILMNFWPNLTPIHSMVAARPTHDVDDSTESKKPTVCAVQYAQCLLGYVRWRLNSNNLKRKPTNYY